LSQEILAARSGFSTEFISLVERGRNGPSVAGLARIAKALQIQVKDLFDFQKADACEEADQKKKAEVARICRRKGKL
jgi:transcriptional regulator with XRE-family HTH domain